MVDDREEKRTDPGGTFMTTFGLEIKSVKDCETVASVKDINVLTVSFLEFPGIRWSRKKHKYQPCAGNSIADVRNSIFHIRKKVEVTTL